MKKAIIYMRHVFLTCMYLADSGCVRPLGLHISVYDIMLCLANKFNFNLTNGARDLL